ncbi:hypothetical protein EV361DRAFT_945380 [Lentinula raphanica]|uniref:Protein-S-isoprenylcysteine O-methyltransferase n=1 Tax=Lentinula raphanica TaxID=153919 RepID=A0AA38UFF4_9AGAR|nr:hypothetical protein F5878DRAFT_102260 [Lentinula raphanica]KAJ3976322.1 hypothetical protein EV361DRAFT_945380 [Lentinula raphanica]
MGASCVLSIPLIFSAVALHHKAFTSPNPPPKTARNSEGIVERTLFRSITFVTVGQKGMAWFVGGAEAAVIVAKNLPAWKYSNTILKHLVGPNGHYTRIGELDPYFCIGTGLIIAGGALRWSCYRTLGKMFTYEVSVQKEHKLITSGPYSFVRHPSYAGVLLIIAGLFIWQGGPNSWMRQSGILTSWAGKGFAAVCAAWLGTLGMGGINRTRTEDAILAKEFGEQWSEWAARVPYLLFPYIY